jgi:hypothetical protein
MRILKEYSAIRKNEVLDGKNSIELQLNTAAGDEINEEKQNAELQKAFDYLEKSFPDAEAKVLNPLRTSVEDIYLMLSQYAGADAVTQFSCVDKRYYCMLIFEFSESALPMNTLNGGARVLSFDKDSDYEEAARTMGFMDVVNIVSRVDLSVDKINGKMRLAVIKEKNYKAPALAEIENLPDVSDEIVKVVSFRNGIDESEENIKLVHDFSKRVYRKFGENIDKFISIPELLVDNIATGELSAIFLEDKNGNCLGGTVWQKNYGIVVMMVFCVFANEQNIENYLDTKMLLYNECKKALAAADSSFLISKIMHSQTIAEFFDSCDETYNYKALNTTGKKLTSYIKPDLIPLIKNAYNTFSIERDVRELNFTFRFNEPYSVLTAKIDAVSGEALLSVLWPGDDLKNNIIRHVNVLKKIGISTIYFRLNLSVPEEAFLSDLVRTCGFEAKYLWPFSEEKGDVVVFVYSNSGMLEARPCVISKINRDTARKIPALVRSVYGENYPVKYLYDEQELLKKIRKRGVYSYVAIDDYQNAIGMISLISESGNPYLFEIGHLMVDPKQRGTNIANQLVEYLNKTAYITIDYDAAVSESVTNHKFSQRSSVSGGFSDCALKLNIMAPEAYALEDERRQIGRMTCVVGCRENFDENFTVYLPGIYAGSIKFCFNGLKSRKFVNSNTTLAEPAEKTELIVVDDEKDTSRTTNFTIVKIGSDIAEVVEKIDACAKENNQACILINVALGDPNNEIAVNLLRAKGFFFGGIMPYWLPYSDALLMQKLYNNAPDWSTIKLFSKKIRQIAEIIKADIPTVE